MPCDVVNFSAIRRHISRRSFAEAAAFQPLGDSDPSGPSFFQIGRDSWAFWPPLAYRGRGFMDSPISNFQCGNVATWTPYSSFLFDSPLKGFPFFHRDVVIPETTEVALAKWNCERLGYRMWDLPTVRLSWRLKKWIPEKLVGKQHHEFLWYLMNLKRYFMILYVHPCRLISPHFCCLFRTRSLPPSDWEAVLQLVFVEVGLACNKVLGRRPVHFKQNFTGPHLNKFSLLAPSSSRGTWSSRGS